MTDSKPTLSLCMIMKNEERWIAQCLQSVQCLADEIIIVDTGSVDRSIEIAKSLGAKVFEHAWEDHFSKSRNRALSYATGDWILVLDADEVIASSDKQAILELIRNPPAPLIFLLQLNYIESSETYGWKPNTLTDPEAQGYPGYVESPLVRLFKRGSALFQGRVHEHAEPVTPELSLFWSSIRIHHYGKYSAREVIQRKNNLYLNLGLKKLEETSSQGHAYYELGAQYIELGKLDEAQEILLKGEKISPHLMSIQILLAHVSMKKNQVEDAINRFRRVLDEEPQNLSPYIYLPGLLIDHKQYELAEDVLNRGEVIAQSHPAFHLNKGALKVAQGNYRKAIRSYLKAIEINPYYYTAYLSLGNCYVEIEEWAQATLAYEQALKSPKTKIQALKGLGVQNFKQKKYDTSLEYIELALLEAAPDSLEKNLLLLWKAITLVSKKDMLLAKKSLQNISSFNDFEELHLKSLNDCLKKISTYETKGVSYDNHTTR